MEVHTAFFRKEQDGITFVQHRLWAERERVKSLMQGGARFSVCGDGRRMAPAVRETLGRIHQERNGCSAEQAEGWLRQMEQEGRSPSLAGCVAIATSRASGIGWPPRDDLAGREVDELGRLGVSDGVLASPSCPPPPPSPPRPVWRDAPGRRPKGPARPGGGGTPCHP